MKLTSSIRKPAEAKTKKRFGTISQTGELYPRSGESGVGRHTNVKMFSDVIKDATVQSVHAGGALDLGGNDGRGDYRPDIGRAEARQTSFWARQPKAVSPMAQRLAANIAKLPDLLRGRPPKSGA